jgi:hypothetical protein
MVSARAAFTLRGIRATIGRLRAVTARTTIRLTFIAWPSPEVAAWKKIEVTAAEEGFAWFFRAQFPRVVSTVYLILHDHGHAEEPKAHDRLRAGAVACVRSIAQGLGCGRRYRCELSMS